MSAQLHLIVDTRAPRLVAGRRQLRRDAIVHAVGAQFAGEFPGRKVAVLGDMVGSRHWKLKAIK